MQSVPISANQCQSEAIGIRWHAGGNRYQVACRRHSVHAIRWHAGGNQCMHLGRVSKLEGRM